MPFVYADRVRETSTSTGTGTFALAGAVSGFRTFASGIGANNTCYYTISHRTASEWEVGYGTLDSLGTTLTRTAVQSSSTGSAVVFSAGTKDVFVTIPASALSPISTPNSTGSALQALTLSPFGTSAGNTAELRLLELAANGSQYVGFKSPDSIASNLIWTLPNADGARGQFLQTNGSASLAWNVGPYPCQGRLTLVSNTPAPSSDTTGATTIYFTPYLGNVISLWNSTLSAWENFNFTQISISIVGLATDTNFDLFVYNSSGTPTLFAIGWTNNTTRATALASQNGVLVASGSPIYRYVGTFRTNIGASATTEDSSSLRLLWNYYNRITRNLFRQESTASWTYALLTQRYQFNSSNNRLDVVCGEPQGVNVEFYCDSTRNAGGTSFIGISSQNTSVSGSPGAGAVALLSASANANMLNMFTPMTVAFSPTVPIGYISFGAIEWQNGTGFTTTFYGNGRSGLRGTWAC